MRFILISLQHSISGCRSDNDDKNVQSNALPILTLYTKYPCPLCDELGELNFFFFV